MKGFLLFGACFLAALGAIAYSLRQPFSQPPPTGIKLTPLSDLKKGGSAKARGDKWSKDGKSIQLVAIVDWSSGRGVDGKGKPLDPKELERFRTTNPPELHAAGAYFEAPDGFQPQVVSIGGKAVAQWGYAGNTAYGMTHATLDLRQPVSVVIAGSDRTKFQAVATIACQDKGESQGFKWRLSTDNSRWQVMREKDFIGRVEFDVPSEVTEVNLGFSTEREDRLFPRYFRTVKWSEFESEFFGDDLENGVYGTVWSSPRWVVEYSCPPAKD